MDYDSKIDIGSISVYTIKTGRWRENSYVVFNHENSTLILIDPGGEDLKIERCINALSGKVDGIYLTHAHHDHVGALNYICEKYNLSFFMDQADYKIFRRAPLFAMTFESRELKIPTKREMFYSPEIFSQKDANGVSCIKTPGHTEGGVIVCIGNVAFTGDTLLNKLIGRTDLPGSNTQLLAGSINKFLEILNEDVVLFPGHGNSWTVREAKTWWSLNSHAAPEYREE